MHIIADMEFLVQISVVCFRQLLITIYNVHTSWQDYLKKSECKCTYMHALCIVPVHAANTWQDLIDTMTDIIVIHHTD